MSKELDMTGIDEERLRRFVRGDESMSEEEITHFLDTPCYELTLQNLPAELFPEIASSGCLQGSIIIDYKIVKGSCIDIQIWVPSTLQKQVTGGVESAFSNNGLPNPYEFLDFEGMDEAGPGRNYVTSMLICARDAGQDIS